MPDTRCLLLATLLTLPISPVSAQTAAMTAANLATFDQVWQVVDETHFDPDFNGTDWLAVRTELRPQAEAATSPEELRAILRDMLSRLGQSHFNIYGAAGGTSSQLAQPPQGCALSTYESFHASLTEPSRGAANPGLEIRPIDHQLVVSKVRRGSDAEQQGVTPGWLIHGIGKVDLQGATACLDGHSADSDPGWVFRDWMTSLLNGSPGSRVSLTAVTSTGQRRQLKLERSVPAGTVAGFGNLPAQPVGFELDWLSTPGQGLRVARIGFDIWLLPVVQEFQTRMVELRSADAVIIDLRGNPGGMAAAAQGVAGHFLATPLSLGTMNSRTDSMKLTVNPRIVTPEGEIVGVIDTPLAILTDPFSASTSEVFSAGLQDLGRARLFGEPTAGAALPAMLEVLPNGDLFMHATMDFSRPGGEPVEGRPVEPEVWAPPTRSELSSGHDAALEAALAWIDTRPAVNTTPRPKETPTR